MRKVRLSEDSFLSSTDSRNRIPLGKNGGGLYRVTETSYGYVLERVEVISERDRQLMENKEFWDKATRGLKERTDTYSNQLS